SRNVDASVSKKIGCRSAAENGLFVGAGVGVSVGGVAGCWLGVCCGGAWVGVGGACTAFLAQPADTRARTASAASACVVHLGIRFIGFLLGIGSISRRIAATTPATGLPVRRCRSSAARGRRGPSRTTRSCRHGWTRTRDGG